MKDIARFHMVAQARDGAYVRSFCIPTPNECKKFKLIILHKIGFECPHHLMVSLPLNLHLQNDKVPFVDLFHLPKFWGKKQ